MSTLHSDLATGQIHVAYQWSYANAAARTGAGGFVAGDVGKFARQTDDNSIWILTATTPTWVQVGTGATPGTHTHTMQHILSVEGVLTVASSPLRIYNNYGATKTISKVMLAANTAPANQAIIVDIHKDGTTIFTNQANRPQIAAAANTGNTTTIDVASWAADEYLTLDVDQVGTGTAGSNLTCHIIFS